MTISLAGFHLGTMADAAIYFIRHNEAQLHSTWGRLAKQGQKAPATIEAVDALGIATAGITALRGNKLMAFRMWESHASGFWPPEFGVREPPLYSTCGHGVAYHALQ